MPRGGPPRVSAPPDAGPRVLLPSLPGALPAPVVNGGAARASAAAATWATWWGFHEAELVRMRERVDAARVWTGMDARVHGLPASLVRERIVPALVAELARDPGAERTNAALMALARIGSLPRAAASHDETRALLASHLRDRDASVASTACLALGVLGTPAAAPALVEILRSERTPRGRGEFSVAMRTCAAYALGVCAEGSEDLDLGRLATSELLSVAADEESGIDLRVAAIVALGVSARGTRNGEPASGALSALSGMVADEDEPDLERSQAATSLGALVQSARGDERVRVLDALLDVLERRSTSATVRQGLVLALGDVACAGNDEPDRRAVAALRAAAADGDAAARGFALVALARAASRASAGEPRLVIERELCDSLRRGKAQQRPWAALALGLLGHAVPLEEPSRTALAERLRDERSSEIAPALALSAGLARADAASGALLAAAKSAANGSHAALGLGFLGDRDAIPALRAELRESDHDRARMTRLASALALLGDGELVPELLSILRQCSCATSAATLAEVLGSTGDERAAAPLLAMLAAEHASDREYAWASYALGVLADRRSVPWISLYATQVNFLAAPPSLTSELGGGLLDRR